jgi:ABC-2 type transport system permease protein
MSHVFVIAQKELRSFFVSPIAYVVVGLFALLFGVFFYSSLGFVLRISLQAGMMQGAPPININEFMIRPLFGNTAVIMLFVLPIITMRSYAEEKRSGTMELLRSSPLTDVQIIGGKFLGALALFALMLGVTAIHMSVVFLYGEPELWPVLTGYLGLFLMGASFISIGLLISSATKNQAVAAMVTFAVLLMFWVISWLADPTSGSTTSQVLAYLSVLDHFDDFSKGVIDTSHLMYYVSFITFGLFLTAKSVDSERWRG